MCTLSATRFYLARVRRVNACAPAQRLPAAVNVPLPAPELTSTCADPESSGMSYSMSEDFGV